MLLVEPRQWAAVARYRLSVVIWPFLLTLVVSSLVTAYPMASHIVQRAGQFAAGYDKQFDPMMLTGGKLSVIPEKGKKPLQITGPNGKLIVRPEVTGLYHDTSRPMVVVLTQNHIVYTGSWRFFSTPIQSISMRRMQILMALSNGLQVPHAKNGHLDPPPVKVDSTSLLATVNSNRFTISFILDLFIGLVVFVFDGLWCGLMIIMISPLIAMLNRPNGMPLGRAYRISLAVMVPLLAFRSLLVLFHIVPIDDQSVVASFLLFISPMPLAIWAGLIAARMYAPFQKRKP